MNTKNDHYYTYILECWDGTYYIGKTINLEKRLAAHNGLKPGGAKYTKYRRPVFLKYYEKFETLSEALKREIRLKKLTRKEKTKLLKEF